MRVQRSEMAYAPLLAPAAAIFIPFYAALLLIAVVSFVEYRSLYAGEIIFTLQNYAAALVDNYNQEVLVRTIRVGLIVSVVSAIISVPVAYAIVRTRNHYLRLGLILVTVVPFLVNALVRVFALTTVLNREGFINFAMLQMGLVAEPRSFLRTEFAVDVGQTYFVLPFSILTVAALMAKLNVNVEHAASTLGANPWQVFFRVTLPRLFPAIFSAGLVAYALSVSAFVVPLILGGARYKMYSNLIYDQAAYNGDFGRAAALAIVLLIISVSLAELFRRLPSKIASVLR